MNGPEHYREAERLIGMGLNAAAQVHATLALVAVHAHHAGPGVDGPARVADDWAWDGIL